MSLSDKHLHEFSGFARDLALAARDETLPRFRQALAVENKKEGTAFDPVTEADREAEAVIRTLIEARYPGHGILGEEHGEKPGEGPFRWVLDPVDGTRAFVCGVPSWTTLIALEYEGRPVVGVIDQPWTGEMFIGAAGAKLHDDRAARALRVSGETGLAQARLSTTDPRAGQCFSDAEAAAFAAVAGQVRLTRFGLDACAYALLAAGHFDLVIEAGLQHYDAAALVPVVEQAGGIVTDWTGKPVGPGFDRPLAEGGQGGRIVAAASAALLEAALACLAQAEGEGRR